MNKHAYLIVAYNNWKILNLQLQLLDYEYNDIYLMVDLKSKDFEAEKLYKCKLSSLYLVSRKKIYWAEYSQVDAFIQMISFAKKQENGFVYSYFHFFSGTCLPIKSNRYIYNFCEKTQKNFIGIVPKEFWYSTQRVRFWWPFLDNTYYKRYKLLKLFTRILAKIQHIVGINRLKNYKGTIYNGWDWASITGDFAYYLVEHRHQIKRMFDKTLCPSELWIHTISMNSKYRETLYDYNDLKLGSMRFIDWDRGRPYIWGQEKRDFDTLMKSPYLWARKFDELYMEIVERIFKQVNEWNSYEEATNDIEIKKDYN